MLGSGGGGGRLSYCNEMLWLFRLFKNPFCVIGWQWLVYVNVKSGSFQFPLLLQSVVHSSGYKYIQKSLSSLCY